MFFYFSLCFRLLHDLCIHVLRLLSLKNPSNMTILPPARGSIGALQECP